MDDMLPAEAVDIVVAFYDAIARREATAMRELVANHFDATVFVDFPPSVPHGGRVTGIEQVARAFAGSLAPHVDTGVRDLSLRRLVAGDDSCVAEIEFEWRHLAGSPSTRTSALELWTFVGGRVAGIEVFYRDPSALRAGATTISESTR